MLENASVIDLTLTLSENLPCASPEHVQFQRKIWNWYSDEPGTHQSGMYSKLGPYYTEWLTIDEHTGTHFDAPSHYIPYEGSGLQYASAVGNITGEKVDPRKMIGPAVVIDVTKLTGTGSPGVSPLITVEMIEEWEKEHGAIKPNDIVLLYTGWDRYYLPGPEGDAYFKNAFRKAGPGWPSPDAQTVEYLYQKGVQCIATDSISIGATHEGISAHVAGLSKQMAYVESLTNLDKLPTRGAYFIFLGLKIEGSSGGPGRAIAFVPNS
ncbi:cyclase family protein [Alicyclobacillus fastidiosus]|uniref:Cyclase family protein n=1 Tax=Alicyclobacillus fastidiosus TaxID=392011 RepID=A0ABV5ABC0_9BACL|nr:cyclase family protein [Alicyclobacillus fastidiosus]WEH10465.1 cyclase family protein [Alicyclobacillus fastidiosus]